MDRNEIISIITNSFKDYCDKFDNCNEECKFFKYDKDECNKNSALREAKTFIATKPIIREELIFFSVLQRGLQQYCNLTTCKTCPLHETIICKEYNFSASNPEGELFTEEIIRLLKNSNLI